MPVLPRLVPFSLSVCRILVYRVLSPLTLPCTRVSFQAPVNISPDVADVEQLEEGLRKIPGVLDLHELHVWSLNTSTFLCTAHVVLQTDQTKHVNVTGASLTFLRRCPYFLPGQRPVDTILSPSSLMRPRHVRLTDFSLSLPLHVFLFFPALRWRAVDKIKQFLHQKNIHSSTIQTEILDPCRELCDDQAHEEGCAVPALTSSLSNCHDFVCDDGKPHFPCLRLYFAVSSFSVPTCATGSLACLPCGVECLMNAAVTIPSLRGEKKLTRLFSHTGDCMTNSCCTIPSGNDQK